MFHLAKIPDRIRLTQRLFTQNYFLTLILLFIVYDCQAMNWGHLLTGTPDVLKKEEGTAGTLLFAGGASSKRTIGFSPFAYMIYNFFNIILREQLYQGKKYSSAVDLMFFDSIHDQQSYFEQTSWTARFNNKIKVTDLISLNSSLGLQYFFNEKSPYSLRPDPLGRYRSFMAKDYDYYDARLSDFRAHHRDPKTISVSLMPEIFLTDDLFINIEYGILGINYLYPLQHFGASVNYQFSTCDIGIGASRSIRKTPILRTETIDHTEAKLQFYF